MAFCYTRGAPALITRPGAVSGLALSRTDAGLSGAAALTWTAAADGLGNPVNGYRIFRDGVEIMTVSALTAAVSAPGTDGASYAYSVQALGRVPGQDGTVSGAVTLTAHAPYKEDYHYTSSGTITIPLWTERMVVTCIGGGGFGGMDAYNYDIAHNQTSAGSGAGGAGEKTDATFEHGEFTPGAEIAITVGAAGASYNDNPSGGWSQSGSASSFGTMLSARGGQGGETPGTIYTSYGGRGGMGGGGGIGGPGGPGTNHAIAATGADWNTWQSWTDAQWYVLCDAETGKRLGPSGKSGAGWCGAGKTPARGNTTLPGTQYGKGGNGWARYYTDGQNQESDKPTGGIVSVRFWRYLG